MGASIETEKKKDRHKPGCMLTRIRHQYTEPLAVLVERNATDNTEEVNRAVRLMLEREGLWPYPPKHSGT